MLLVRVLDDTNLRKDLIAKGQERLKQFSWKQTAEQTKKIYESVLISNQQLSQELVGKMVHI